MASKKIGKTAAKKQTPKLKIRRTNISGRSRKLVRGKSLEQIRMEAVRRIREIGIFI